MVLWGHVSDTIITWLGVDFQGRDSDSRVAFTWRARPSSEDSCTRSDKEDQDVRDQNTWMVSEGLYSCYSIWWQWWRCTAWFNFSCQRGRNIRNKLHMMLETNICLNYNNLWPGFVAMFLSWSRSVKHLGTRVFISWTLFSWLEWHRPLIFRVYLRKRYVQPESANGTRATHSILFSKL